MEARSSEDVEYTDCISAEGQSPNECPDYDIKQSGGKALVILEFGGMWSAPSFVLLLGPLRLGMVATEKVISLDQIQLFNTYPVSKQITYTKLSCKK